MSKIKKAKSTKSFCNGIKESARTKKTLNFRLFDFGCSDELDDLREQTNELCHFLIVAVRLLCLFFSLGFFIYVALVSNFFVRTLSNWVSLLFSYICVVYLWTFVTQEKQKKLEKIWWKIALFCIAFSLPVMSFKWSFCVAFTFVINVLMMSFCILMSALKAKRKDTSDTLKLKMLVIWLFLIIIGTILMF